MSAVKKKIIWLAHEANLSGANIALLEYVDVLDDLYDFHVILPHNGNMKEGLQQRGIPFSIIYQYNWTGNISWWRLDKLLKIIFRTRIAISESKKLIQKENADIVFTNTLAPFVACIAAQQLHKPHIWWIHEFGEEDFGFRIGWGHQQLAFRKMEKRSRLIICNSEAVAKKFRAVMPAANIKRLYQPVTWNGTEAIDKKRRIAKFLMFGQISPSKGQMEVLEALSLIKKEGIGKSPSIHIKGPSENPEYLDELVFFIESNGLQEHVEIETGFFKKEEVMPLYEVLIVASRAEAFGRVIVEANKAGLKVIVKNAGGAPELINETNGLLYNDVKDLADIFSGAKQIPICDIRLNYYEKEEINKLKNWLVSIA